MIQSPPVDPDQLPGLLSQHRLIVVHLWAPWNAHDRTMDRMIGNLIDEFRGRVEFRSRDIELGLAGFTPRPPEVLNVPTLVCLLDGLVLESVIGVGSVADLRIRLEGWAAGLACRPILYGSGPIAHDGTLGRGVDHADSSSNPSCPPTPNRIKKP